MKPVILRISAGVDQLSCDWMEFPSKTNMLDDITNQLPAGAYTTFRTYHHSKAIRLEAHLARLEETTRLSGTPLKLDQNALRHAIRLVLETYPTDQELRLRVVLDLEDCPGEVYLMAEILITPPPEAYRKGVWAVTCGMRRRNPKAKLTRFIDPASKIRANLPEGANEALMVTEDGSILEGLSSNFFAVNQGEVWTNEESVLSGVTRSLVLDEIERLAIPFHRKSVHLSEIPLCEEAFITSSSRGILPLNRIDQITIGCGLPGRVTRRLMENLEERIQREIEEI